MEGNEIDKLFREKLSGYGTFHSKITPGENYVKLMARIKQERARKATRARRARLWKRIAIGAGIVALASAIAILAGKAMLPGDNQKGGAICDTTYCDTTKIRYVYE